MSDNRIINKHETVGEEFKDLPLLSFEEFKAEENWKDHVCEYPGYYVEKQDPEDPMRIFHEPAEGAIIQRGTPVNSKHLGVRDYAIYSLYQMITPLIDEIQNLQARINAYTGATGTNSFVIKPDEFTIIDGYYDAITNRVIM